MSSALSARGYWYSNHEPAAYSQTVPFSFTAVNKLATLPWASAVYSSEHLKIYQINRAVLAATIAGQ